MGFGALNPSYAITPTQTSSPRKPAPPPPAGSAPNTSARSRTPGEPDRGGERDRLAVDLRHVEKDLAALGADQRHEHRLRGGAIVRHQRADLAAAAARPDDAPGGKLAVAQERASDMAGRRDPEPQERGPRRRKDARVVARDRFQRHLGERHGRG